MAYQSEKKPPPDPPKIKPTDEFLIEFHRDKVRELDARGYLPNAIAAITHAPYCIVEAILSTPAKPKKRK